MKKYIFTIICLFAVIGFWGVYALINLFDKGDPPFMLLPNGLFSLYLAIASGIYSFVKRKYLFSIICVVLFVASLFLYNMNNPHVAENGTLIESFGYLPMGWIFFVTGFVSALITFSKNYIAKKQNLSSIS